MLLKLVLYNLITCKCVLWLKPINTIRFFKVYSPFVSVIRFITNRNYAFFSIYFVTLSPDNQNSSRLDQNWPCNVIHDLDWQLRTDHFGDMGHQLFSTTIRFLPAPQKVLDLLTAEVWPNRCLNIFNSVQIKIIKCAMYWIQEKICVTVSFVHLWSFSSNVFETPNGFLHVESKLFSCIYMCSRLLLQL